jgi:hypothetical protein
VPAQPGNGAEDEALAALQSVRLESFKAEPSTIAPFYSSRLTWAVSVPDPSLVEILLDRDVVSHNGERWVAPPVAQSYQLSARAGHHSRILRTVTVHVDFEQCAMPFTQFLPAFLVAEIEAGVEMDTSGLYLRPKWNVWQPTVPPIPPVRVWITPGRLNVTLRLGKRIAWFPDPVIEIAASFGLEVVREMGYYAGGGPAAEVRPLLTTRLAPTSEEISVDVTFDWWAWAAPGAVIALIVAISGAEEKARAATVRLIADIADGCDRFPLGPPPHTEKEAVDLYVDGSGHGIFEVTFCPPPKPIAVESQHVLQ